MEIRELKPLKKGALVVLLVFVATGLLLWRQVILDRRAEQVAREARERQKQYEKLFKDYEQLFAARGYALVFVANQCKVPPSKEWDDLKRWAELP